MTVMARNRNTKGISFFNYRACAYICLYYSTCTLVSAPDPTDTAAALLGLGPRLHVCDN